MAAGGAGDGPLDADCTKHVAEKEWENRVKPLLKGELARKRTTYA